MITRIEQKDYNKTCLRCGKQYITQSRTAQRCIGCRMIHKKEAALKRRTKQ